MEANSLAERVIQANEQEIVEKRSGDGAPDGYYTDDLGLWVEQDIRKDKMRFARYIYMRCKKINKHLHIRNNELLFNSHTLVNKHPNDISELANLPEILSVPIATWVYNRLIESVPHLDPDRIVITDSLIWNMETCEFEDWSKDDYTTVS